MRRIPEAFVPTRAHYYTPSLRVPVISGDVAPMAGPVAAMRPGDLYPPGFANAAPDPHAVYPHLSVWDRQRVREARAAVWEGSSMGHLAGGERALAEAGL